MRTDGFCPSSDVGALMGFHEMMEMVVVVVVVVRREKIPNALSQGGSSPAFSWHNHHFAIGSAIGTDLFHTSLSKITPNHLHRACRKTQRLLKYLNPQSLRSLESWVERATRSRRISRGRALTAPLELSTHAPGQ